MEKCKSFYSDCERAMSSSTSVVALEASKMAKV